MKKIYLRKIATCLPSGDTPQEDLFHFIEREKK